jgi:hypothetical protein
VLNRVTRDHITHSVTEAGLSTRSASESVSVQDAFHPVEERVTQHRALPSTVATAATGTAAMVTAVAGLVGVPVAPRPAVVGAAVRLSTCKPDGDGPRVPPYEAMPVQFMTLHSHAATAGLATATNSLFIPLCFVASYVAARGETAGLEEPTMRASLAYVAATVPLSYIGPALVEFSVPWLTAVAVDTVKHQNAARSTEYADTSDRGNTRCVMCEHR